MISVSDLHRYIGILHCKLRHGAVKLLATVALEQSDLQKLAAIARNLLQLTDDVIIIRHQHKAFLVEKLACGCQCEAALFAFKKRHAKFFLQCLDLLRNCRLGDIMFLCGGGEAAEPHHRLKIAYLFQHDLTSIGRGACKCKAPFAVFLHKLKPKL